MKVNLQKNLMKTTQNFLGKNDKKSSGAYLNLRT